MSFLKASLLYGLLVAINLPFALEGHSGNAFAIGWIAGLWVATAIVERARR